MEKRIELEKRGRPANQVSFWLLFSCADSLIYMVIGVFKLNFIWFRFAGHRQVGCIFLFLHIQHDELSK